MSHDLKQNSGEQISPDSVQGPLEGCKGIRMIWNWNQFSMVTLNSSIWILASSPSPRRWKEKDCRATGLSKEKGNGDRTIF